MPITDIPDKLTFSAAVEKYAFSEECSHIDAVLHLCSDMNLDPKDVAQLITPMLKSKIEAEAMKRHLLPQTNTLSSFL